MGSVSHIPAGQWTLDDVEEAFVECHDLWRRSPGGGKRPFAGDAPWHLLQRSAQDGDYCGDGQDGVASSTRPRAPLNTREIAQRDRLTGWLQWIADPVDRRIVWYAAGALHREESRVPWKELAKAIDWERSRNALAWRYKRSLAAIVCRLNGLPARKADAIATAGFMREQETTRGIASC